MMCSVRTALLASTFCVSSETALKRRRWAKWAPFWHDWYALDGTFYRWDDYALMDEELDAHMLDEGHRNLFMSEPVIVGVDAARDRSDERGIFEYHPDFDRIGWPG